MSTQKLKQQHLQQFYSELSKHGSRQDVLQKVTG